MAKKTEIITKYYTFVIYNQALSNKETTKQTNTTKKQWVIVYLHKIGSMMKIL